jgi:hypothetical protein
MYNGGYVPGTANWSHVQRKFYGLAVFLRWGPSCWVKSIAL